MSLIRNFYLIIGGSGSGKTTLVNLLYDVYGYKPLPSYTTRPMRHEDEEGHTFITEEEFYQFNSKDFVAYSYFGGYHYFVTPDQVETSDLYVIDPDGVIFFKEQYSGNRSYRVIYIDVPKQIRMEQMARRGDSPEVISHRMHVDAQKLDPALCYKLADYVLQYQPSIYSMLDDLAKYIKQEEWK